MKISPVLPLTFLAVVSLTGAACGDVAGWFDIGAPRFLFHEKPESFADASAICQQAGGHIVYDNHPMINKILAKSEKLQWIGATDAGHEGKWTWTNGAAIKGGNWWPGEPNNCCGGQNCAVVNFGKPGKWDDQGCALKHPFHCQIASGSGFFVHPAIPGRALKVFPAKKNWNDARKTCQLEGGDLVNVDHPVINAWLSEQDPKLGVLWIGATDNAKEGTYVWTNGSPASKEFWWPGEPNNCCGGQNCAVVNFKKPGKWDDQGCAIKNSFACQIVV